MAKQFSIMGLSVILVLGVVTSAHSDPVGSLAQVIEGAKKEATVLVKLRSGILPKSLERIKTEIKEKFGVELKIISTPSGSMPKDLSESIMEYKVGTPPSYDLMTLGAEHVVIGLREGIFEKVDWTPLLPKEVSPDVVVNIPPYGQVGPSYYTDQQGLLYNPEKVSAAEVPRTLSDLANPKWKGRVGVFNYPASWSVRAVTSGKDKVLPILRAILKNGAIQGRFQDLNNHYMLGEISFCFSSSVYLKMMWDKGLAASWQNLDFVDEDPRPLVLRKGARNPNAAKLLAIYLASPQGAKFMLEESGAGNSYYAGNYTHDLKMQGVKQGMQIINRVNLKDFFISEEYEKWAKEIALILETGGAR